MSDCQDPTLLGTFTENQDQPRLANYTDDVSLLKNAVTFALLTDGIPIIYYGAEQQFSGQKDPGNREALWLSGYNTSMPLYPHIAAINAARNAVANASTYDYWSPYWTWKSKLVMVEDDVLVVRKGYDHSITTVMTNKGQNSPDLGPYTITDTNFIAGDEVMDVLACTTQTVQQYGKFGSSTAGQSEFSQSSRDHHNDGKERLTASLDLNFPHGELDHLPKHQEGREIVDFDIRSNFSILFVQHINTSGTGCVYIFIAHLMRKVLLSIHRHDGRFCI